MRLRKLNVGKEDAEKIGLQPISIDRLGSIIGLFGKNGAGKTRILEIVADYANLNPDTEDIVGASVVDLQKLKNNLLNSQPLEKIIINGKPATRRKPVEDLERVVQEIVRSNLRKGYLDNIRIIKYDDVKTSIDAPNENVGNEFTEINKGSVSYFRKLSAQLAKEQWKIFNGTTTKEKSVLWKDFERIQYYMEKFLGLQVSFTDASEDISEEDVRLRGDLLFNKKPLIYSLLSPGQKVLFSYALYFFNIESKGLSVVDKIIILDEPEIHLHPDVQGKLIDALRSMISDKGQLWIATHSIHVLAHLRLNEIFYVENGGVYSPSRNTPSRAFDSLMGAKENIERLSSFIDDIAKWEEINFVLECFINPEVFAAAESNDPEIELFQQKIMSGSKVSVLDFGGGKGRLGMAIENQIEMKKKVGLYDVFDPNCKDYATELNKLSILHNTFTLINEIPKETYDIIVLCGVLHEIHINSWLHVFQNIGSALKSNGHLLIIEDLYFPTGENPSTHGFLVMGSEEFRLLFDNNELVQLAPSDLVKRERIQGTLISKANITSTTHSSMLAALNALKQRSYDYLSTHKERKNVADGRKFAFFSQQFINANFALDELDNPTMEIVGFTSDNIDPQHVVDSWLVSKKAEHTSPEFLMEIDQRYGKVLAINSDGRPCIDIPLVGRISDKSTLEYLIKVPDDFRLYIQLKVVSRSDNKTRFVWLCLAPDAKKPTPFQNGAFEWKVAPKVVYYADGWMQITAPIFELFDLTFSLKKWSLRAVNKLRIRGKGLIKGITITNFAT